MGVEPIAVVTATPPAGGDVANTLLLGPRRQDSPEVEWAGFGCGATGHVANHFRSDFIAIPTNTYPTMHYKV